MDLRSITHTLTGRETQDGEGVRLRRVLPSPALDQLDPFLLLDHIGPMRLAPKEAKGFPDHPHRGFETVTYLLEGQFQHRDSFGNHGLLEAGGVQWMTAGSGLVHSEMPGPDLVRDGGRLEGFQLWVNLPRRDKMTPPRYQELDGAQVPAAQSADGRVRVKVIAGEALGVRASVSTHTPITYLHFTLLPGAEHYQPVPRAHHAFAYTLRTGQVALYAEDGDTIELANTGQTVMDLLLIAGEPLNEPVARYGPFVMNTKEELYQAFEDYRTGKMGTL
jgi:redox-sensitive bicupin YhaK (pirin superfamily)